MTGVASLIGIHIVVAIGGADMPVVIALLNSYSGIAAAATGFVVDNNVLIIAGSLVGASGLILTKIMCKAMNRSLANVLFSGFGATTQAAGSGDAPGLRLAAHSLKSNSADFGAMSLNALCKQLEMMGKDNQLDGALPLIDQAEAALEAVRPALMALGANN